jgi:Family of unknown function (DUF5335)
MTTRKLDKNQWRTFFDGVSKLLQGKQAEIEVASLRLGDQVQAEWLPLHGIAYDPKDDPCRSGSRGPRPYDREATRNLR